MKLRPAKDIVADLLREATPRAQRAPKRPTHAVDLTGNRVISVSSHGWANTAVLDITESDRVRLTVVARGFLSAGARIKRKVEGEPVLPIAVTDAGATLTVQLDTVPDALIPGAVLSKIKVTFALDALAEVPTILAMAENVILEKAEPIVVPVTLGAVTLGPLPPIDGVDDDPVEQAKAERWLMAAWAYQDRQRRGR